MSAHERELGSEKLVGLKELRLVTAESAKRFGIVTESPVFISPYIKHDEVCSCGVIFKPLVYPTGFTVQADHFHDGGEGTRKFFYGMGGIYYHDTVKPSTMTTGVNGWLAEVTPISELSQIGGTRAKSVRIDSMRAFCFSHNYREELREGLVVSILEEPDILYPHCEDVSKVFAVRYRFNIKDGFVHFSNP